jgi:hypothetical protein
VEIDTGSLRLIAPDVHGHYPVRKARFLSQFRTAKNKMFCHAYFPAGCEHSYQIRVNENTQCETCFSKINAAITNLRSSNYQVAEALL